MHELHKMHIAWSEKVDASHYPETSCVNNGSPDVFLEEGCIMQNAWKLGWALDA
jgi:hypothetical protein